MNEAPTSAPAPAAAPAAPVLATAGMSGRAKAAWCIRDGFRAGGRMALWLLKIMVPVSLAVAVLDRTHVLGYAAGWLDPVFRCVGLPAETVVAFLTGLFLNIYSAIAALGSIELTDRQVTILALICLISHNFPVEMIVQKKAGTAMWRMIALRLGASIGGALLLNWMFGMLYGPDLATPRTRGMSAETWLDQGLRWAGVTALDSLHKAAAGDLWAWVLNWAVGILYLSGKVGVIVTGLMILQRVLREFGLVRPISAALGPGLRLMGLPREASFLWIVGNTLGLAYGGPVLLEEIRTGQISVPDAQVLNRSIAVCHSLLEDTLLFAAIGAWAAWIIFPRLVLAALAAWGYRLGRRLARRG